MLTIITLSILAIALSVSFLVLFLRFRKLDNEFKSLTEEHARSTQRFQVIIDVDAEKTRVLGELESQKAQIVNDTQQIQNNHQQTLQSIIERREKAENEVATLQINADRLRNELSLLDETAHLQSFGFYKPHYSFSSSEEYQWQLENIRNEQKWMIKQGAAAICQIEWAVNGSRVEGRKQTNQTLKLILRAFNGECDAAIAKVKYNNVQTMEARILKSYEAVNKLVTVQNAQITGKYLELKLKELYLAHEYQEKLQEEKEEQRRIREELREEEIARRQIAKALEDAERDEEKVSEALIKARGEVAEAIGQKQQKLLDRIQQLEQRLAEAQANKERAIARAQMTRSGYVYVISNLGSFGENVYKIGMTRRLDPMERVIELGDASVPFRFDVHALIFSEDAPALESALHRKFRNRRINQVNERREFFRVTLDEIALAIRECHGEIDLTLMAEAAEYRKTVAFLESVQPPTSL